MNPTWSRTYWSTETPFTTRHLVSLFFALILLWVILLIPIKKSVVFNKESDIKVELVRSPVKDKIKQPEQPLPKETVEKTPTIEEPQPIKKVETKPPIIKKDIVKELPKQPSNDPKVTIKKTVIEPQEPKIPDAGMILNSLNDIKSFAPMDDDFQALKDNTNEFKSKNMVPQQPTQLTPFDKQLRNDLTVKDSISAPLKAMKTAAGFLSFVPIDDKEKTSDDMQYCPTLGRKSKFCPSSNPLNN